MFKKKTGRADPAKAYAYLPSFMFTEGVSDYERWCVQLMYLVRDTIKDEIPENVKPYFSDKFMADNVNMFVMNEASTAMDTFLTNLDEADIKVPIALLEPLLATAKYIVNYGTTKEQFEAMCKRLLANAKTSH